MAWTPGPEYYHKNLSTTVAHTDVFDAGQFGYIEVSFAGSGTVRIYSEGDYDTIGYLTLSPSINTSTGIPSPDDDILAESDDISDEDRNFRIVYDDIEAGTTYYIWYRMISQSRAGEITIYIAPPEPEEYYKPDFSNTQLTAVVDGTNVTLQITGLDPSYDDVWQMEWYLHESGSDDYILDKYIIRSDEYDSLGSYDRITLSSEDGLKPDTIYIASVTIRPYPDFNAGAAGSITSKGRYFTTGAAARPAKFKWADGTTEKKSGQEFDITADEWCDLLDNINAVREYKGYSKFAEGSYSGTYYYNYFTYPSSGDTFRYQHYNQALNAITGMKGSGYTENAVVKGAAVTADRINYLVSTLNGIT